MLLKKKQMSFWVGFFNSTLKSAASDNFSLLLNRFFLFPAQKVHLNLPIGPGQAPTPCGSVAVAAAPSLSLEHLPGTHTTPLWTAGTGTRLPEPDSCLLLPFPAKILLLISAQVAKGAKSILPFLRRKKTSIVEGSIAFSFRGLANVVFLLPLKLIFSLKK